MHWYLIAVGLHWLPKWQDRSYRASRELCSNYLLNIFHNIYNFVSFSSVCAKFINTAENLTAAFECITLTFCEIFLCKPPVSDKKQSAELKNPWFRGVYKAFLLRLKANAVINNIGSSALSLTMLGTNLPKSESRTCCEKYTKNHTFKNLLKSQLTKKLTQS